MTTGISPEIVDDGVNGFLIDVSNPASMTRAMEDMIGRRSEWGAMGAEGRSRVERFAAKRVIPAYETQYQEWLTR